MQIVFQDLVFKKLLADSNREYKSVDPRLTLPVGISFAYTVGADSKIGFEYLLRGIGFTSEDYVYTAQLFTSLRW